MSSMQFESVQEELDYWRNHAENLESTLQETRAALDEFQVSSRELEEELEKELQTTEKAYNDLKSRCEHYKREAEDWKNQSMSKILRWCRCNERSIFSEQPKSHLERKYWN
ncbi:hypothetical protein RMCBS344292_11276 [Rhizopus microsporus]|nr:hypothetical protein RMCBS344292_11276 [Rhizopus microsporus]